jgi:hypothetical protein
VTLTLEDWTVDLNSCRVAIPEVIPIAYEPWARTATIGRYERGLFYGSLTGAYPRSCGTISGRGDRGGREVGLLHAGVLRRLDGDGGTGVDFRDVDGVGSGRERLPLTAVSRHAPRSGEADPLVFQPQRRDELPALTVGRADRAPLGTGVEHDRVVPVEPVQRVTVALLAGR